MSTVNIGAYAVFQYSSALNAQQVDNAYLGQVPTTSNSTGTWTRLYTSFDNAAMIECNGNTVDLMTQEEGLKGVAVITPDTWTIKSGIADMSYSAYRTLLQLNPLYTTNTTATGQPLNSSIVGTDLLTNGLPILVVHKSYQNLSTGSINTPVVTDPMSFFFCKAGLGERKISIGYDPKKQQVVDYTLKTINCTGSSYTNVMGYFGTITAAAS